MKKRIVLATIATVASLLVFAGCSKEQPTAKAPEKSEKAVAEPAPKPAEKAVADFTFESGTEKWVTSGKNSVDVSTEKKHGGNSSLKISGLCKPPAWNYAVSQMFDLEPNKTYRLSGWMLVDSLGDEKNVPYFKVGMADQQNKNTPRYDLTKKGEWQQLSVEFTTSGATKGNVAVEKNTNKAIDSTIYIDDVKLEALK